MKKEIIFLLLLIFSAGLLVPVTEQEQTITVLEDKQLEIAYNVHSPRLFLESDIPNAIINVNMTKINPNNGDETNMKSMEFTGSAEFTDVESGFYVLSFLSDELVGITISGKGVYLSVIVIFVILILINTFFAYRRYMD
ncbi:MAG: hypothetical protein GPJ54_12055 [Candidatus Heimdallarchaeota archaeon]|nr:hypothetical protein [Candidatus Heimdallarchaeota archaeon]